MSIREATADWMDISFYPLATLPLLLRPPQSIPVGWDHQPTPRPIIAGRPAMASIYPQATPTPARTHIATSYHLKRAHVS